MDESLRMTPCCLLRFLTSCFVVFYVSSQWMVVSWIDSKAMFGDELTYVQEHQSQLLSYVNRSATPPTPSLSSLCPPLLPTSFYLHVSGVAPTLLYLKLSLIHI